MRIIVKISETDSRYTADAVASFWLICQSRDEVETVLRRVARRQDYYDAHCSGSRQVWAEVEPWMPDDARDNAIFWLAEIEADADWAGEWIVGD